MMFYKLSNTADVSDYEEEFDIVFRYPSLLQKSSIINGLIEESLPIIKMDTPQVSDLAIWGLLPQDYKEEWQDFQNVVNTLNVSICDVENLTWIDNLLKRQRCVVMVSGFFTSYLYNGEVYPFYVYEKNHRPFGLAGVYSTLNDGFLSFSLLTSDFKSQLHEVHNIGSDLPIALTRKGASDWLDPKVDFSDITLERKLERPKLKAHPISKEFYKNNITFNSILEPAHYNKLPTLSFK